VSEEKPKLERGLKAALVAVSILLVISVGLNVYLSVGSIALRDHASDLQDELNGLQNQASDLQGQVSDLESQIDDLNNELADLKKPCLNKVAFTYTDYHPWLSTWYVKIQGYVYNSGWKTVTNVEMHIKLYDGDVVIRETSVSLSDIYLQYYINVDVNVLYYSGDADEWKTEVTFTYTTSL